MAAIGVSFEELLPEGDSVPVAAPVKAKPKLLGKSFEELLPEQPAGAVVPFTPEWRKKYASNLSVLQANAVVDTIKDTFSLKNIARGAAAINDMFTAGIGAGLMGGGAQVGVRAYAFGAGESNIIGGAAGKEALHIVPEHLAAPLRSVAMALGDKEFDDNSISRSMAWIAEHIEEGSDKLAKKLGKGVQPGDIEGIVNALMTWGGFKVLQHGVRAPLGIRGKPSASDLARQAQERAGRTAELAETDATTRASESARIARLRRRVDLAERQPGTSRDGVMPLDRLSREGPPAVRVAPVEVPSIEPRAVAPVAPVIDPTTGRELHGWLAGTEELPRFDQGVARGVDPVPVAEPLMAQIGTLGESTHPAMVALPDGTPAVDLTAGKLPRDAGGVYKPGILGVAGGGAAGFLIGVNISDDHPLLGALSGMIAGAVVPALLARGSDIAGVPGRGGQTGSIHGPGSGLWNRSLERQAIQMKRAGKTADEIWDATKVKANGRGLFQGKDGKWRQELPTDDFKVLQEELITRRNPTTGEIESLHFPPNSKLKLGDIVDWPSLYKAYPEARNIPVNKIAEAARARGYYKETGPLQGKIGLQTGMTPAILRKVAGHEITHVAQGVENFSRGGTSKEMLPLEFAMDSVLVRERLGAIEPILESDFGKAAGAEIKAALQRYRRGEELTAAQEGAIIKAADRPYFTELRKYIDLSEDLRGMRAQAQGRYKALAGEVEASVMEARLDMTPAERAAEHPMKTAERLGYRAEDQRLKFRGAEPLEAEAVKPLGGMWHPEAVEKLAEAIEPSVSTEAAIRERHADMLARHPERFEDMLIVNREARAINTWATQTVRTWLNRYAGTSRDPLSGYVKNAKGEYVKDPAQEVQIPFGDGVKGWEAVTDKVFGSKTVRTIDRAGGFNDLGLTQDMRTKLAKEPVWSTEFGSHAQGPRGEFRPEYTALQSYLSHAGDYIRANVLPKLNPGEWFDQKAHRDFKRSYPIEGQMDAWVEKVRGSPEYKAYLSKDPLAEYDLVRLIKETAAWDKEMARKATKEREGLAARQLADRDVSPVLREYPNGTYWQQLDKPGQFARESTSMGHSLRGYEPVKKHSMRPVGDPRGMGVRDPHPDWIPESEFGLPKGQLSSGSPDYGLGGWEAIKRGDAKIYSLRNAKGESLATVEVAAQSLDPETFWNYSSKDFQASYPKPDTMRNKGWNTRAEERELRANQSAAMAAWANYIADTVQYRTANKLTPPDITQIKGPSKDGVPNRKPPAEAMPYIQDLVKKGNWGEVGDFQNTDLIRLPEKGSTSPRYLNQLSPEAAERMMADANQLYDLFDRGELAELAQARRGPGARPHIDDLIDPIEAKYPGERYVSKQEARDTVLETIYPKRGPGGSQAGNIDPRLLGTIAAVGGGAAVGASLADDSPLGGAFAGGALGGLAALGIGARKPLMTSMDRGMGVISTRLKNINPVIAYRLRRMESNTLENVHAGIVRVDPFLKELSRLDSAALNQAVVSNSAASMAKILNSTPALAAGWIEAQKVLHQIGLIQLSMGRIKAMLPGYFPRIVKDVSGLLNALGKVDRVGLDKRLHDAEMAQLSKSGTGLSNVERTEVINHWLQYDAPSIQIPGYSKARMIRAVTAKILPFYAPPAEALHTYIRSAVQDIEKARFFGKHLRNVKRPQGLFIDTESSIGALVREELDAKRITSDQSMDLRNMLDARFGAGEHSTNAFVQGFRNITNAGLLGNVVSAATQFGDPIIAGGVYGLRPTLLGVVQKLTGRSRITPTEMGLVDNISVEFATTAKSAKFLNFTFKYGLFKGVDMFGKGVIINAALNDFGRMANTNRGVAEIARRYQPAFGGELPQLIRDLQAKKNTALTRRLVFNELSDMQPISKIEMPEGYLRAGHTLGGIPQLAYMLKSFMLKQADLLRDRGYNEIRRGNVRQGLGNLVRLGIALGVAGATTDMIKDFISGKPFDPSWEDIPLNVLKTFALTEYMLDKAKAGQPIQAVLGTAVPPFRMWDEVLSANPKAIRYFPGIGPIISERIVNTPARVKFRKDERRDRMRDITQEKRDAARELRELQ